MIMSSTAPVSSQKFDVIIVGAGFGGVFFQHELKKRGYKIRVLEASDDLGGIWNRIRYPGFRVDSEIPYYEFSDEELWKDWTWKERFPGRKEVSEYFSYVDEKWDVSQDVQFNTSVVSASFDTEKHHWTVNTEAGEVCLGTYLLLCTGIGSKPYTPDFKGLDTFKGTLVHAARWPEELDYAGKRVGVIGTGASGVQIIQEVAKTAGHLTVFQRTPNFALPMRQRLVSVEKQEALKKDGLYPVFRRRCLQTFSGFHYDFETRNVKDVSTEERRMYYEDLWEKGGFQFWLAAYGDTYRDEEANQAAYAFWKEKARARIPDPVLQEKLAPTIPPHPFGIKRPSLEQYYYETYSRPNVTLVDIKKNPLAEITPKGIKLEDGTEEPLDILILATGFDTVTGGITAIDIKGLDGISIGEKWKKGIHTYLGSMTHNFPNVFWVYGPQAPSHFCNGPTCVEMQGNYILKIIDHMRQSGHTMIEPTREAEVEWRDLVLKLNAATLWEKSDTWYMGSNIPGKTREPLAFVGGVPHYRRLADECIDQGYKGFKFL